MSDALPANYRSKPSALLDKQMQEIFLRTPLTIAQLKLIIISGFILRLPQEERQTR